MAKRGYESQKTGQKVDDLLDKIDNLNVPEWALQANKPSYTAQEVHALPENTSIPKKTSDLVNDKGFISQESDPTVPSWAKQPTKPGYTAQEVGALPSDTPLFSGDYNDLRNKPTIPTVPENVSAFNNDAGYLTDEDMGDYATKQELQSKQDTINDLASIRSGASAGATAYQKPQAGIPESDLSQGVKDKMNEKEVFWATYGTTTAAEIDAAVQAGKIILCSNSDYIYVLAREISDYYYLHTVVDGVNRYLQLRKSTNVWSGGSVTLERTSNKVETIIGNETSTGKYPSTKAVVDYVAANKEVFVAEYGVTTFADIYNAIEAGKAVFVVKNNTENQDKKNFYGLFYQYSDEEIQFTLFNIEENKGTIVCVYSDDSWDEWDSEEYEISSLKTSSWRTNPDNTHYPSEKLVKDSLDVKAGIGDVLFANFSNLTPKKTFEYDVSDTAYHPLFSRANTGISQLMSEVDDIVKFRITVTGTNIYARVDVVVRFQPAITPPAFILWNEVHDTGSTNGGINTINCINPKSINNGYDWFVEFSNPSGNTRHIKVEVFEDTEAITWIEEKQNSSYNSTYQSSNAVAISGRRGLCANQTWYLSLGTVNTSNSASYITGYQNTWVGGGVLPLAGEALNTNQLGIISNSNMYRATNKNVPIDCDCGVFLIGGNFAIGAGPGYAQIRQKITWGTLTGDPALTFDTFARGDQVYLRCTLGQDGKIYPDGHLSNVKSAGYTWVHIGTAASATAINLDTCGKPFITLNNDGKVTHINGTAVMDSSMSKWGVVSQTQTWTQASDGGYDYTMSDLQYGWIPQANIDLYEAAGAVFNEQSGYFELNGLTDLSYEEMGRVYALSIGMVPITGNRATQGINYGARSTLPVRGTSSFQTNISYWFWSASNMEQVFIKDGNTIYTAVKSSTDGAFQNCNILKTITGYLRLTSTSAITNLFTNCKSLENVSLNGLAANTSLSDSPRLSAESVAYMINKVGTPTITITLHPTAYARAIADSDVQVALQAHTNVSLASA